MKILIMSDIHSNFEALKEVFNYIKNKRIEIDECFILGDAIGYGPFPNETLEFIKNLQRVRYVAGNHEWGVAGKLNIEYFNEYGRRAILWKRKVLTKNNMSYIFNLDTFDREEYNGIKYRFLHASPLNHIEEYIVNSYIAKLNFKAFKEDVCFYGHTHIPMLYLLKDDKVAGISLKHKMVIGINRGNRYLINVGSVGQPRDGDSRSGFGILDTEVNTVTLFRIKYDYRVTQEFIKRNRLPQFLADRLSWGR